MAPTVKELEKEVARLKEQNAGLLRRVQELESAKTPASKSRQQAEQVKAILEKDGIITKEQLSQINSKYVSDPIFYYRNLLHGQVVLVRGVGYLTPQAHSVWQAEQAKKQEAEKKATEAKKQEAKKTAAPAVTPAAKEALHAASA